LDSEDFLEEEVQAEAEEEPEAEFEFEKELVEQEEEPELKKKVYLDSEDFLEEEVQAEAEEEPEAEFEFEKEIKDKIDIFMDLLGEKIAQTKAEKEGSLELEKEEIKAKIFTLMDLLSEKHAPVKAKDEVSLDLEEFVVEQALVEPEEPEVEFEFEKELVEQEEEPEPKKEEEKPEDENRKVLMIVEDQMLFNLIVESLEKVGTPIEITYVENGSQALKSLRMAYELIIMDSKLTKADPNFIIKEMEKWKIKTPLILLDNGRLRKIPKKLNTIAVLKRKQMDIRSITKHVTKIF
jgi:CheY-like chemotaxis protein